MKQFDLKPEDLSEDSEASEATDANYESEDSPAEVVATQRATWREIEKRRELLALSRMIGENIDDHIFND